MNCQEESTIADLKLGTKIIEGKTKEVFAIVTNNRDRDHHVLLRSKDAITAFDGTREDKMDSKSEYSTTTTCAVFDLLKYCHVPTHYVGKHDSISFVAMECNMIPLEFVVRRVATGSFLKRHPGVEEGFRFSPLKVEFFYKDDANHDPLVSIEQIVHMKIKAGKSIIQQDQLDIMTSIAICTFEILERAWATLDCTLIDLKVEFGISVCENKILLADVIDNDSWRLWVSGDKRLQKDKQAYRDLKKVTAEAMEQIKLNYLWVAEKMCLVTKGSLSKVIIFMGSKSDLAHCNGIANVLHELHIDYSMRVSSAHKSTNELLKALAHYEECSIPTVIIAVAGRSNGLGPVISGNTTLPVINCPPSDCLNDVWSSLRLPSGLSCCTVLNTDAAALMSGQILGINNHIIWGSVRGRRLKKWLDIKLADMQKEWLDDDF